MLRLGDTLRRSASNGLLVCAALLCLFYPKQPLAQFFPHFDVQARGPVRSHASSWRSPAAERFQRFVGLRGLALPFLSQTTACAVFPPLRCAGSRGRRQTFSRPFH